MSDSLDKNGAAMAPADRAEKQRELSQLDTDFQRKQREFREDLNQRRNEELAAVLDRANKVIKQIAEQQHYDLIVQEAVYVSPRIDITDQVLKALAAAPSNGASSATPGN
jgi:outer membrane protein